MAEMHRTARSIVRSDDLAWDVVQETALALWQRGGVEVRAEAGQLRAQCVLRARQLLRSSARRQVRERAVCEPDAHEGSADLPLLQSELGHDLARAIGELPVEQRVVFVAYELGGHAYDCIARERGLSIGTVRSRLHRARQALRERLQDELQDDLTHGAA